MAVGEAPAPLGRRTAAGRRVLSLSIVVPAKNEAATIGTLIRALHEQLGRLAGLEFEILVIDDGSTDGTAALAAECGARVIRHSESLGNGAAIKRGIREAEMGWILLIDADLQHPPHMVPALLAAAESYDMVVASRGGGGGVW